MAKIPRPEWSNKARAEVKDYFAKRKIEKKAQILAKMTAKERHDAYADR